jgi:Uma2 family endonuclease
VEVVSPADTDEDVQAKVLDYLRSSTHLVWVIRPALVRLPFIDLCQHPSAHRGYARRRRYLAGFYIPKIFGNEAGWKTRENMSYVEWIRSHVGHRKIF